MREHRGLANWEKKANPKSPTGIPFRVYHEIQAKIEAESYAQGRH